MLLRIEYTQGDRGGTADFMGDAKAMMDGGLRLFTTELEKEHLEATLAGALVSSICLWDPVPDESERAGLSSLRLEMEEEDFEGIDSCSFYPALGSDEVVFTSLTKKPNEVVPTKRVRARRERTSPTSWEWSGNGTKNV